VVGKTADRRSLDDLRIGVGTTSKWFLRNYGERMGSGCIWLVVEIKRRLLLKMLTNLHSTLDAEGFLIFKDVSVS
jgi:hypothetical protein